jgi:hypothetical protein
MNNRNYLIKHHRDRLNFIGHGAGDQQKKLKNHNASGSNTIGFQKDHNNLLWIVCHR